MKIYREKIWGMNIPALFTVEKIFVTFCLLFYSQNSWSNLKGKNLSFRVDLMQGKTFLSHLPCCKCIHSLLHQGYKPSLLHICPSVHLRKNLLPQGAHYSFKSSYHLQGTQTLQKAFPVSTSSHPLKMAAKVKCVTISYV